MTPEGRIKALVKRRLAILGADCWLFMPVQNGFGAATLDFLGAYRGLSFAVETKKDAKSRLTPRQEATKAVMEAAGVQVFVVYDETTAQEMMINLTSRKIVHER